MNRQQNLQKMAAEKVNSAMFTHFFKLERSGLEAKGARLTGAWLFHGDFHEGAEPDLLFEIEREGERYWVNGAGEVVSSDLADVSFGSPLTSAELESRRPVRPA